MSGFSYNGVHCDDMSVGYAPDAQDRWFKGPEFDIYDTDVSWHDGGYYYGHTLKNRTFTLKCYYEEITVAQREKIRKWLRRDTGGRLIFDERPFVYYDVRPSKVVEGERYNDHDGLMSGTFTVVFKAYKPLGYLMRTYDTASTRGDGASDYCGLIMQADMPPAPALTDTQFSVYNPGTEICAMTITLRGTTDNPIRFYNSTNGSYCEFTGLPEGAALRIDGETGNVYKNGDTSETAFEYHEDGFVMLEPCEETKNVGYTLVTDTGSNVTFALDGVTVTDDFVGYIVMSDSFGGARFRVIAVNKANNQIITTADKSGGQSGSYSSLPPDGTLTVQQVNNIQVQEKNGSGNWAAPATLELSVLTVAYNPRIL